MPLRVITAPGVQINEIDKSGYTTVPTGTSVYLKGFTDKGEAYRPIEITTRSAYELMYGVPDTEAERYTYAAACETLNQGGRLWMARLPYDNMSFEKMVGIRYDVKVDATRDTAGLVDEGGAWHEVYNEDNQIKQAATIYGGKDPVLYDLSAIEMFRNKEMNVPANTFLIVDTTGATYGRIQEDDRKGVNRELIGIVPVVTTAANALYVQNMISVDIQNIYHYESFSGSILKTLVAKDAEGNVLTMDDGTKMQTKGLSSSDCTMLFDLDGYYKDYKTVTEIVQSADWFLSDETGVAVFQEQSAAWDALDEAAWDGMAFPKSRCSLSSWYSQFMLSGEALKDINAWVIKFRFADGYAQLTADPEYDEVSAKIDELNEKSLQYFYECKADAQYVGGRLANEALAAFGYSEKIDYSVEDATTKAWKPFNYGYDSEEDRNAAFAEYTALTAEYKSLSAYDSKYAGKDVYAIAHTVSASVEVPLLSTDPRYGWHGPDYDDSVPETISLNAAQFFPAIQPASDGVGFDPEHLKDIGVVIYKAYLDVANGNLVSFEPVEAYVGSLCKDDKDPNTGVTKFIDEIINTQSKYINFFSNCFTSTVSKKFYKEQCDIVLVEPSAGTSLGFYTPMTKKDISVSKSILDGMNKAFEKVEDINKLDIDIVVDAGLANIASYVKAIFGDKGPYDLSITDDLGQSLLGMWQCKKATDPCVKMWKTVEMKHDNFCKNIRKDCMFIADGLRPLVLQGQKKTVRDTYPLNTIDKDILPYVLAICGLNTSYGAGYIDWFEMADDYTGDFFWCPPSIKAMGAYINTDLNYEYWDAPAGLTRGVIAATDVAFSPNARQAGKIYEKCWNYAISYPQDGIILEGQKTFQTKPTALDRVNVRRMLLRLERQVYRTAQWFVYEANTAYTRQRVIDAIEPIMKACWKSGNGGIARYKIVCDDKINDANTIDNNELKVQIGVVPNKTAEFIVIDFICGSQSSTWAELLG